MTITFRFYEDIIENEINTINQKLKKVFQDFSFYHINQNNVYLDNACIQNIDESDCLFIAKSSMETQNDDFFIICLKKSILIIDKSLLPLINFIFEHNKTKHIFYLSKACKDLFNDYFIIKYNQFFFDNQCYFYQEITAFIEMIKFKLKSGPNIQKILDDSLKCIAGYLIMQAYFNNNKSLYCNLFYFNDKSIKTDKVMDDSDYIVLRTIGNGSSSIVELIYDIENEEIFAIKKFNPSNESENLFEREKNNYLSINYPLLPKIKEINENNKYLIIQFIDGRVLSSNEFNFYDKIIIIFEIILSINYLNEKGYVYRDLKPSNVIIGISNTAFLVDFDRMIKYSESTAVHNTLDLQDTYSAPEISYGEISYTSDVYSIGQIIYYIMNEKHPKKYNTTNAEVGSFGNNPKLQSLYKQCTNDLPDKRPSISELLFEFYYLFHQIINESLVQNFQEVEYLNGLINYQNIFLDIKKSFQFYYLIASKQNNPMAQYIIAGFYIKGGYIKSDFNKGFHYLTLAADNDLPQAQYDLAILYFNGYHIFRNINKAIHYFTRSADQNFVSAQICLGEIYEKGIMTKQDNEKSIHYYILAANQNSEIAQLKCGMFYYMNKNTQKSIQYFQLAAYQNNPKAQLFLGCIYYEYDIKVRDINKAIYYFQLAAGHNLSIAYYYLGLINYFHVKDINTSIYYYQLAANQNYVSAQNNLGMIYYEDRYVPRDINKAIFYFTLAAKQNHVNASAMLGDIYFFGAFIYPDIKKAIQYYTIAAEKNHAQSQYMVGGFIIKSNVKLI